MSIQVKIIKRSKQKRVPAIQCEGSLSVELGEAIAEMLPLLLEVGTPLPQISKLLWGKQC